MSIGSGYSGNIPPERDDSFDQLPAWDDRRAVDEPRAAPRSKVPPTVRPANRHVAPQVETILRAVGLVLVVSALVAAVVVALPRGDGDQTPTATVDPGLVIASSGEVSMAMESTPVAETSFDARNASIVICLDPGHGGKDMGHQRAATASAPAMDESYFNLTIARHLEQRLEARGFQVILTRNDDVAVNVGDFDANQDGLTRGAGSSTEEAEQAGNIDEMQARIDRCNDGRADLLVSIHVGGSPDPALRGSRVLYDPTRTFAAENQLLASLIYEELGEQSRSAGYPWIGQGVFDTVSVAEPEDPDAGHQLLLLAGERDELKEPSAMPGVIVDVLTLTNDADAVFLSTEQGIVATGRALDQAIIRFVEETLRDR